ncbi:MAG: hypothetical protein KKE83_03400 [Proteobacteria bacterium]|nr:hypothetical protein [Pseudomonadota bacterium]
MSEAIFCFKMAPSALAISSVKTPVAVRVALNSIFVKSGGALTSVLG